MVAPPPLTAMVHQHPGLRFQTFLQRYSRAAHLLWISLLMLLLLLLLLLAPEILPRTNDVGHA